MIERRAALLAIVLCTTPVPAALAAQNGVGDKPLMGWSSWSSLKKGLNESNVKANADVMASRLKSFGYTYINIDAGWRDYDTWDQWGRETWNTSKWPNGGMVGLSSYLHGKGLKFGQYLHPGMDIGTNSPWERNTPIQGTSLHARDITDDPTWGNTDTSAYRIDFTRPGSHEYIQSYANLMASWGVDYIKFDFVGPGGGKHPADNRVEMAHWRDALIATGRPVWIGLSNSLSFTHAATWRSVANGWRINGDIESGTNGTLGSWNNVMKRFNDSPKWAPFAGPGGWNDFDAIPIGNGPAENGITQTEGRTAMTLWSISCSPLIIGGDLRSLDSFDEAILTNPEVIAVNQAGRVATPISQATSQQVWRVQNADGSWTVALFNLGSATATVTARWSDLGFSGAASVRDLWSRSELGSFTDSFSASIASHGTRLLKVAGGPVVTPTPTPTPTPVTPTPTRTPTPQPGDFIEITPGAAGVSASTHDGNLPANAVDNNLSTRWSANGDPQWIRFDLGSPQVISHVNVAAYSGNTRRNRFDLQVGPDGVAWTTVVTAAETSGTTTQEETFQMGNVAARWVRYLGHGNSDPTKAGWNSVAEVSVFSPAGPPTPTPTPTPPTPTPTPGTPTPTPTPGTPTPTPATPTPTPTPTMVPTTLSFEAESLTRTPSGAAATLQTDTNASGGQWVMLEADGVGDFIDYALPSIPAGTYQLRLQWKGNNNRGQLSVRVDGAPALGATIDQYSAGQTYVTTTVGTVTFPTTAAHTVRLTATGKATASSSYRLSADRFILISQ